MAGFIDQVVSVEITATSATPSVPNFGTPAIIAYFTHWTDLIRTYADLSGMVDDGFSTTEPAYLMAQTIVEQNPRPPTFKVIRSTTAVAQSMTLLITQHADGTVNGITLTDPSGVAHSFTQTASSQTTAQVATALASTIDAQAGITASASSSTITVTVDSAGAIWYPSGVLASATFADTTGSTSSATDLGNALLVDDDWYGVSGEWLSSTNIHEIATWVEANKKIHAYTTYDTLNLSANSGIMDTLKDAGYQRTYGQYSATPITYGALGLMAQRLTADPGSDTWAFKQIAGTSIDTLTPTQEANITTNNGNYYISIAGVNCTFDGRSAEGIFIDIIRGIDSLSADIQDSVFTLMVNSPKVPYTRKGIAAIGAEVSAALQRAVATGFLSNDSGFEPAVTVPNLSDVSTSDKQNRILRNVNFSCYAQGAIQKVLIQGVVNI